MIKCIKTILITFFFSSVFAQEVEVKAIFLKDSVKVGEHIQLSLSTISDKDIQLLYPSKDFNFYPFELVEKTPYNTVVYDSTRILDSAIYTLRTFNMDTVLTLQLPVYKITSKGDSIKYFHEPVTVELKRVLPQPPQQFQLKTTTDYIPIPVLINWPFWIALLVTLVVVLGITLIFTGKPLLRYIAINRITKRHQKFLIIFKQELQRLKEDNNAKPDKWVQYWKNHATYLSKQPLKSYTTKDFKSHFNNEALTASLTAVDSIIYGGKTTSNLETVADPLITFSNKLFNERIDQIKNGKRVK